MSVPFPLTPEDATFVFVLIPINSVALSAVLSYLLPNGFQISFFFFSPGIQALIEERVGRRNGVDTE